MGGFAKPSYDISVEPTGNQAQSPPATAPFTPRSSYAIVMNVKEILGDVTELPLLDGYVLRRATEEENLEIDKILTDLHGFQHAMGAKYSWTTAPMESQPGFTQSMPPSDWRFHVISFSGVQSRIHLLQNAFNLATPELQIGFTCTHRTVPDVGYGFTWGDASMFQFMRRNQYPGTDEFFVVSSKETQEIMATHQQLEGHDNSVLDLRSALIQLAQLRTLPLESPLVLLGFFALLESLLTHYALVLEVASFTRPVRSASFFTLSTKLFRIVMSSRSCEKMYSNTSLVSSAISRQSSSDLP